MVSWDSIEPVETIEGPVLVAMAVYIGKTRLIDNFIYEGYLQTSLGARRVAPLGATARYRSLRSLCARLAAFRFGLKPI